MQGQVFNGFQQVENLTKLCSSLSTAMTTICLICFDSPKLFMYVKRSTSRIGDRQNANRNSKKDIFRTECMGFTCFDVLFLQSI